MFWEVIHLFQQVGCVRNKLQFRTVQQNPKPSLWTLDWDWTGFPLSIYGIWLFLSLETWFRLMKDRGDPLSVTRIKDLKGWPTCWITLIVFPQTFSLRIKKLCCMCLKTTKQWSRWSLKEGVPQWDRFPGPTELRLIGCSIELTWTQNPNQVHPHQKPTCRYSNQRKFHTWWVELLVVLVQYQPFHFYSLLWNNGENTSTKFRRRPSHSKISTNDEPYCKGAVERIILDFSEPGEEKIWNQNPWSTNAEKEEGSGRLDIGMDRMNVSDYYYLEAIDGKFLLSKLLQVGWWPCLVFSRVENWYWDVWATGETRCNFLGSDTRIPSWFLSRGNSSWWNRAIRCEWDNTSWRMGSDPISILKEEHGLNNPSLETMKQN